MITTIAMFFMIFLIAYIVGLTIVSVVDKKLSNISINLPKQDIIIDLPKSIPAKRIDSDYTSRCDPLTDGAANSVEQYVNYMPAPIEDICYEDHKHNKCQHGATNYPDPQTMTPIDKRYFKYNYPQNLTLQDYVNWLMLYKTNPDELPYNHLRNLKQILAGDCLKAQPGVVPPPSYINLPLNTAQYFNKLYNEELDITRPLNSDVAYLPGANINQYPANIADRRNKPEILYPKYGQVV